MSFLFKNIILILCKIKMKNYNCNFYLYFVIKEYKFLTKKNTTHLFD